MKYNVKSKRKRCWKNRRWRWGGNIGQTYWSPRRNGNRNVRYQQVKKRRLLYSQVYFDGCQKKSLQNKRNFRSQIREDYWVCNEVGENGIHQWIGSIRKKKKYSNPNYWFDKTGWVTLGRNRVHGHHRNFRRV